MHYNRIQQAARNNAAWCNAVCSAHGRPGEFLEGIWINRRETPPFYPNAVTLSRADDAQRSHVQALSESDLFGPWAVKDSFRTLHLETLGFAALFDAEWLWRRASLPVPMRSRRDIDWCRIRRPADLTAWETAWRGDPGDSAASPRSPIFQPALLADSSVAVFAARQHTRIIAGGIANRSDDVVGISNVFVCPRDNQELWGACLAAALNAFPGLSTVGYSSGAELALAESFGFERLGPLRIWTHTPARVPNYAAC